MSTYLNDAMKQLRRTDHLLYVSLKYTRTVDILKSILRRLTKAFDNGIQALLQLNVAQGKLSEVPGNLLSRVMQMKSLYPHSEISSLLNFYKVMRKIGKEDAMRSNEYRRGVRMSVILKDTVVEVDIDTIEEYFRVTETFIRLVKKIVQHVEEKGEEPNLDEVIRGVHIDMEFEKG